MILRDYLTEAMALDYKEGEWDCAIFVARWADLVSGSKFEENLNGTYRNKLEGLRKFAGRTGPVTVAALAVGFLQRAGWRVVDQPEEGDVIAFENGEIGIATKEAGVKLLTGRVLGLVPPDLIAKAYRWEGGAE